ncbi:MAG: polyhydroxybutyrate depolymerase [Actinoplanes sp.]|jgi:polyhydroxybutyrate depolymerase|nr:polyhydroxybutyrate depolymerase [Actinoplanes sp.]
MALILLAGCTAHHQPDGTTPAPTSAAALPVGQSTGTMRISGTDRTYRVYRPADLPTPAPLVLVLHGAAGTGRQAEESYGWDAEADHGRFLAVFPDGVNRTWDADADCCGVAARDKVDDVGFLTQLVGSFASLTDKSRIYATGISNGALMSYRLACDTTVFAAIAAVSGTMINSCARPAPISILAIHGTADATIPYNGGPGKRSNQGAGTRLPAKIDGPAVPALMQTWRKIDDCGPAKATTAGTVTTSTATCPQGRSVELITVAGAGHQWPGGREAPLAQKLLGLAPPSTALKATPTIWTFFAERP